MDTTKTKRSEELRSALAAAEAELQSTREALGLAVADGDADGAGAARSEVERLERTAAELRAAIPISLRREREAAEAEAERQRRARERSQNKARKARLSQAKRVDKLMAELGREYEKLRAMESGGTGADGGRLVRRARYSARGAFAHFAPALSRVLEVPVIPAMHRRPLAESESGLIREFEVEESE